MLVAVLHLFADLFFWFRPPLPVSMLVKPYNKEVSIDQESGTLEKVKLYSDGSARDASVGAAAVLLLYNWENQQDRKGKTSC
jgi:hypothetical protein